jgi:hypothetical protein
MLLKQIFYYEFHSSSSRNLSLLKYFNNLQKLLNKTTLLMPKSVFIYFDSLIIFLLFKYMNNNKNFCLTIIEMDFCRTKIEMGQYYNFIFSCLVIVSHSIGNMHFINSPTFYFQVSGILLLALRMESNLLVMLVSGQILMA